MATQTSQSTTGRRRFLKTGCLIAAGAGVVLCGGGTAVLTLPPKVDMPSVLSSNGAAAERILVTYASKAGATAEVALKMSEILTGLGQTVDMLPVKQVGDLAPYRAVVLGSAIWIGSLLPDAMNFIEKNQVVLKQKAFSVFVLCMTLAEDTQANRDTASSYMNPVRALVKPASEGLFAGVINPQRLSLLEQLMMKQMKSPVGDFRNWEQINDWTKNIPVSL